MKIAGDITMLNKNNKGNTAIEYALLAVGISVFCLISFELTGTNTKKVFCSIASSLSSSSSCSTSSKSTIPPQSPNVDFATLLRLETGLINDFYGGNTDLSAVGSGSGSSIVDGQAYIGSDDTPPIFAKGISKISGLYTPDGKQISSEADLQNYMKTQGVDTEDGLNSFLSSGGDYSTLKGLVSTGDVEITDNNGNIFKFGNSDSDGTISNSKDISGMNGLLGLQQIDKDRNPVSGTILY